MKRLLPIALSVLWVQLCCTTISGPDWIQETALDLPSAITACAIGDLDPDRPGNEIAAVAEDGSIHMVFLEEQTWGHEIVRDAGGRLLHCAIGDVDPTHPGNELVVVGEAEGGAGGQSSGAVFLASRDNGGWQVNQLFEDSAPVAAACIVDLDPGQTGQDLVVVGHSQRASRIWRNGDNWDSTTIATLTTPCTGAASFREGIAVAATDGSVTRLTRSDSTWTLTELEGPTQGSVTVSAHGSMLIVARDESITILDQESTPATFTSTKWSGIRFAVAGSSSPELYDTEIAFISDNAIDVLQVLTMTSWKTTRAFEDTATLLHLATGRVEGRGEGECVATCGSSGLLTVAHRFVLDRG